ncbi:hypothetical protein MTP99_017095 [Tenebrio molitor]|nr:hypothetical protein MTP99_017095 [Tenebrio molitor]
MDIQDNVFLTPADSRDDLVRRIVAVCEEIPPCGLSKNIMSKKITACRATVFLKRFCLTYHLLKSDQK